MYEIKVPGKCIGCPEIEDFRLREIVREAERDDQRSIADIYMQDTTDEQRESWAAFGADVSDEGIAVTERERRQGLARAMARTEAKSQEDYAFAADCVKKCTNGVARLPLLLDEAQLIVRICTSRKVITPTLGSMPLHGHTPAIIEEK
jgi:hypothetical protein